MSENLREEWANASNDEQFDAEVSRQLARETVHDVRENGKVVLTDTHDSDQAWLQYEGETVEIKA